MIATIDSVMSFGQLNKQLSGGAPKMVDTGHKNRTAIMKTEKRGVEAASLGVDQLGYMADLIAELREMSQCAGLATLAGILELAETEAAQQVANLRRR